MKLNKFKRNKLNIRIVKKARTLLGALLLTITISAVNVSAAGIEVGNASIKNTVEFKYEQQLAIEKQNKLEESLKGKEGSFIDPKGDLRYDTAFATSSTGSYPTRYGVILVTTDGFSSGIGTGHAGIIWTTTTVIESFPNGGVQTKPNDWNTRYNSVYGITTISTTASQDNEASNWCRGKVGLPYNWNFWNTGDRNKFYCSHLVWASFKDLYGINIDDDGGIIWPVDLVNSKNTIIVYKK